MGRIGWLVACGSRAAGAVWSVALERGAQRETSLPGEGEGQHRPRLPGPPVEAVPWTGALPTGAAGLGLPARLRGREGR